MIRSSQISLIGFSSVHAHHHPHHQDRRPIHDSRDRMALAPPCHGTWTWARIATPRVHTSRAVAVCYVGARHMRVSRERAQPSTRRLGAQCTLGSAGRAYGSAEQLRTSAIRSAPSAVSAAVET
eukprot:357527-Prymnesium_polylepis.1